MMIFINVEMWHTMCVVNGNFVNIVAQNTAVASTMTDCLKSGFLYSSSSLWKKVFDLN